MRHRGLWAWLTAAIGAAALVGSGCTTPAAEHPASPQWRDGRFHNPQPLWSDGLGAWRQWLREPARAGQLPTAPPPVAKPDLAVAPASGLRLTWFGHSSALLEIDGATVLIDPLWSERASPVAWVGPRLWYAPPLAPQALREVDVVLISHDHADHLDAGAITAMRDWRNVFVVPLGVGARLAAWGIGQARIVELDWWQSTRVGALNITATPSRHGSGRLATHGDRSLWAGFALRGPRHGVWYSGDTGFHDQLAAIGERLGPFDLTLIEAGQYDAHWPDTHLGPELAVEAHRLVRGGAMVPVHWGLVSLAPHGWTEPVERVRAAARCAGVRLLTPRPGQSIEPSEVADTPAWWPDLPWRHAADYPVTATRRGNPDERIGAPRC